MQSWRKRRRRSRAAAAARALRAAAGRGTGRASTDTTTPGKTTRRFAYKLHRYKATECTHKLPPRQLAHADRQNRCRPPPTAATLTSAPLPSREAPTLGAAAGASFGPDAGGSRAAGTGTGAGSAGAAPAAGTAPADSGGTAAAAAPALGTAPSASPRARAEMSARRIAASNCERPSSVTVVECDASKGSRQTKLTLQVCICALKGTQGGVAWKGGCD